MNDETVDRAEFSKRIFERLSDPNFRSLLEMRDDDGSYPIVTAMMDDSLSSMILSVLRSGGSANVAISVHNGFTIVSMSAKAAASKAALLGSKLLEEQTVREFLASLLLEDGEAGTFRYQMPKVANGEARLSKLSA
jgi:hypothetical protein